MQNHFELIINHFLLLLYYYSGKVFLSPDES